MNKFVWLLAAVIFTATTAATNALTLKKGQILGSDGQIKTHNNKYIPLDGEDEYATFEQLPCKFNGVSVAGSGYPRLEKDTSFKRQLNRCKKISWEPNFYDKHGTSIKTPRGTPVVAIADLVFWSARDFSAEYRCHPNSAKGWSWGSYKRVEIADPDNPSVMRKCQKIYDGIDVVFKDKRTGELVLYYHLSSTPIVPGFGKGECKWPLMKDRTKAHTRFPEDCGGVAISEVKKGEIVGYSGQAGGPHFGLNTTRNGEWLIAMEDFTKWENLPRDESRFLFPVVPQPKQPTPDTIPFRTVTQENIEQLRYVFVNDTEFRNCLAQHHLDKKKVDRTGLKPKGVSARNYFFRAVNTVCFQDMLAGRFLKPVARTKQDIVAVRKAFRTNAAFRQCLAANTSISDNQLNAARFRPASEEATQAAEIALASDCYKGR